MAHDSQFVEQVFGDALDLPPAQRSAYLAQACRDAPHVRRLVEELLAEDERAGSFLEHPPLQPDDDSSAKSRTQATQASRPTQTTAPRANLPRFQPSERIAGRFVVVRFLARGGMGEVYEVEDSLLQGAHVALKTILPEVAADESGLHRFEQEVLLARKLTHPNLCPIYEIFRCEEPAPSFLFLTMKLLHGETLQARLRRNERIPPDDAARICHQLTAGLGAIHAAGIVHRDIKPNNVMLERSGDKLCVSIMDFGLARLHESEATVLQAGTVAGTPGYLAPELLDGQRPTQATDLFALGVVFHQLLTGERPLDGRRGRGVTPRPSLDKCGMTPELIGAVKDLLADDPDQRCRAFAQLRGRTQDRRTSLRLPQAETQRFTRRRFAFAAAASACALAGGAAWEHQSLYNLLHPIPDKRFVAVLNWPPLTDERVRPMLLGLIDAVADELARAEAFDHNFFVAAQKTAGDMTTPAQLNEVRESLGANLVLATSARTSGEDVHVSLHVLEPATGRQLRSTEVRAPLDQQFSLPQRVVRAAAELLDVNRYDPDDRRSRVGTENPEALAAFQAAEAYRKQDNDAGLEPAIEKYKQALELDPKYAIAQARLGWAYLREYGIHGNAGALALGRENCEAALTADPLLPDAHLGVAYAAQLAGDYETASRAMSAAIGLDPSNSRTLVYMGQFDALTGNARKAEDVFRRLIKLRPNFWLAHIEFGAFLYDIGRYGEALSEFRTASLAAPKNALAYNDIALACLQQGFLDRATENFQVSLRLAENDSAAAGLAEVRRIQKRYSEAATYAKAAVSLNRSSAANWVELGDVYDEQEPSSRAARAAFAEGGAAEREELSTQTKNGPGWVVLALCSAKSADHTSASQSLRQADLLSARDVISQLIRIRVLELLGRRDEAIAAIERALKAGATSFQIKNLPDLTRLRADPRFSPFL